MTTKPIFVATHPRACSTAFERVFMTRRDVLTCLHEPFGDAFYFGPERLCTRYEEEAREQSGFAQSTFQAIFDKIDRLGKEGKRVYIKDMAHYLVPPNGNPATIAPSIIEKTAKKGVGTNGPTNGTSTGVAHDVANGTTNGPTIGSNEHHHKTPYPYDTVGEPGNPTVMPAEMLKQFHFTFLIRHPRHSIPSYWRCTIPPLDKITGFYNLKAEEAGYDELRRLFDFLVKEKQVGPALAGEHGELSNEEVSITVVDADDLLDRPADIIQAYCQEVGIEYTPKMLIWDTEESHNFAKAAFERWPGFHDDALNSTSLTPRGTAHKKKVKTEDLEIQEWREKYGDEAARIIRETVNANIPDYEYLKSFAIKV